MEYRVMWEMNIEADTPEQAAREALEVHRDVESIATVFEVQAWSQAGPGSVLVGPRVRVDVDGLNDPCNEPECAGMGKCLRQEHVDRRDLVRELANNAARVSPRR